MKASGDPRSLAQRRAHYEVEKELAGRLRRATGEERRHLYSAVYRELFERVPDHPMLTRVADPVATAQAVHAQMRLLGRFLSPQSTFLELGPGDCTLSFEVASHVRQVCAVDVSKEIAITRTVPDNFTLIVSDGCSIPLRDNVIAIAYSNQVMEHLHPDDALAQLREIHRVLAPGGQYLCITPNRLSGPYDISRHFDAVATGFHLKEYTVTELNHLLKEVGFSKIRICVGVKGRFALVDAVSARWLESALSRMPTLLRRRLARLFPFRSLLGIQLVGVK
jgi:SAM-dependent methyltransferase